MDKQDEKTVKTIPIAAIIAALIFFAALLAFGWLVHEVVQENETGFDQHAFAFFKSHSTRSMISFFKNLTFFGSPWFLFPAYMIIIIWLLIKKRKTDAADVAIISITGTLLMSGMKNLIGRVRPDLPLFTALTNYSFPSGHALSSFIFCSVLIWLTWKSRRISQAWKWVIAILLILFSLLIGISRIVLRYHYASDVLAGFCLAFVWVLLSLWVQQRLRKVQ